MKDKEYYSGRVSVMTCRISTDFHDVDDPILNHRTDLITFKDGVFVRAVRIPGNSTPTKLPIDKSKKYTKKEITEAIVTAWDKGEYAEDQDDLRLCY